MSSRARRQALQLEAILLFLEQPNSPINHKHNPYWQGKTGSVVLFRSKGIFKQQHVRRLTILLVS